MKTITHDHFIELNGKRVPLNVAVNSGCIIEVIKAAQSRLDAMLGRVGDVFVVHFVVQLPGYTADNTVMSRYMKSLKRRLLTKPGRKSRKRYAFTELGHLWVREKETGPAQHYHVTLMLNGRLIKHPKYLLQEYLRPAADQLGIKVSLCSGHNRVIAGDDDSYGVCLKRVSYNAKERGKGVRRDKAKDFDSGFCFVDGDKTTTSANEPSSTCKSPEPAVETDASERACDRASSTPVPAPVPTLPLSTWWGGNHASVVAHPAKPATCSLSQPVQVRDADVTGMVGSSRGPPDADEMLLPVYRAGSSRSVCGWVSGACADYATVMLVGALGGNGLDVIKVKIIGLHRVWLPLGPESSETGLPLPDMYTARGPPDMWFGRLVAGREMAVNHWAAAQNTEQYRQYRAGPVVMKVNDMHFEKRSSTKSFAVSPQQKNEQSKYLRQWAARCCHRKNRGPSTGRPRHYPCLCDGCRAIGSVRQALYNSVSPQGWTVIPADMPMEFTSSCLAALEDENNEC